MKNKMFLFALCLAACFPKEAATDTETVWLRDVTTRLQTDKRGVTGPDLPDQLSFHLKRRTQNLALNLKRNYQIDPNTDIYIMQKLKDGQSDLEKKQNLEKADVAYYQDMENGAFMTARCVKRSSRQCDIIINGNMRLGDINYNLRPSETDVIQNDFLEIMGLRGKRYVLQDQENIQSGMSVKNNEQTNVLDKNVQEKYIGGVRRFSYEQDKRNPNIKPEVTDKTRNRKNYYVDVTAAADSSVWDLFFEIARFAVPDQRVAKTHKLIREYFLHIVNSVDKIFKEIEDSSISIEVSLRAYVMFPTMQHFPHNQSRVQHTATGTNIDGDKYLLDLQSFDRNVESNDLPIYDQLILFTKHRMYSRMSLLADGEARSITSGVCDPGRRVQIVRVDDFFSTIRNTVHGLGHSLGAAHDGYDFATDCSPNDGYIMSIMRIHFYPGKRISPNLWKLSPCSVHAFKRTLGNKTCLNTQYTHPPDIQKEMRDILLLQPGQHYNADEQCAIINGVGSQNSETQYGKLICVAMRCKTRNGIVIDRYMSAADGTKCGDNKHCQKAVCIVRQ